MKIRNEVERHLRRCAPELLATIVIVLLVVGLSSCAGYTNPAAAAQPTSPGAGVLTPSSTSLNFGDVTDGNSATQSITATNTGTASVDVTQVAISGTGFSIVSGSGATTIGVGQSATVQIQFAPQSTGAVSGTLTVTSNASNSPLNISLSGTGTAAAQSGISVTPSPVNFGSVTVGTNSSQPMSLKNTGTANLVISQVTVTGTGFSVQGLAAQTLAAGASVSFSAVFAPSATGSASGSISITSNAPTSPTAVPLSGTGTAAAQPGISVTPSPVSFGSVVVGTNSSQPMSLKNTGTANLVISQVTVTGAGFSVQGLAAQTVAAGATVSFSAVFAPSATGSASGSISITSNAPTSPTAVPLSGTGVAATFILTANPTSLDFGAVTVTSNSTEGVTLTNTGNSTITISSVTVSGAEFSASGVAPGTVLTPTQSTTLKVTFAPTTGGSASGTVTVNCNATTPPSIAVSGTGSTPSSHTVSLSWTASTTTDVTSYNVYRGTVSGGPYAQIGSSEAPTTQYTDATVDSSQTYYYVVTAVDPSGESQYSNEASAAIP